MSLYFTQQMLWEDEKRAVLWWDYLCYTAGMCYTNPQQQILGAKVHTVGLFSGCIPTNSTDSHHVPLSSSWCFRGFCIPFPAQSDQPQSLTQCTINTWQQLQKWDKLEPVSTNGTLALILWKHFKVLGHKFTCPLKSYNWLLICGHQTRNC